MRPSAESGVSLESIPDPERQQEATLPITGMTCANCALTVERSLKRTPGVSNVSVNFATERATVRYDPSQVALPALAAAVEDAGYGVVLADERELADAEARARADEIADQSRKFWTGVAFAAPLFVLGMARDFMLLGMWAQPPPCRCTSAPTTTWGPGRRSAIARRTWTCWWPSGRRSRTSTRSS
jgi:cation transport ATPase